jgi:hypothetical protein
MREEPEARVRVRVAGEQFCANCGADWLPSTSDLGNGRDGTAEPCCGKPRIVSLAEFLRPEEIEV